MKKTILVVDDFENTLKVTSFVLNKEYRVLEAKSAKIALKMIENEKVDLFITDYNMPEMNGFEFVTTLRQNIKFLKTPIFVLSTETKKEVKDALYKLGITAWVQKPFEIHILKALISKIL